MKGAGAEHSRPGTVCAILLVLVALATPSASAGQAAIDDEARGLVESVAATVYAAAWPTATFERFGISRVGRSAGGGVDVVVRLEGTSGFGGGALWMELALEFENGTMSDLEVRRHNAVLAPPFATARAVGELMVEVGEDMAERSRLKRIVADHRNGPEDRRMGSRLAGTWRGGTSTVIYTAAGDWSMVRDDGVRARGVWTLRNDTLTWHYHGGGNPNRYLVLDFQTDRHTVRNLADGLVWTGARVASR